MKMLIDEGSALLLSNNYVPLALTIVAPIVAGVLLFHLLTERCTLVVGIVPFALWAFLTWHYRQYFVAAFRAAGGIRLSGENQLETETL